MVPQQLQHLSKVRRIKTPPQRSVSLAARLLEDRGAPRSIEDGVSAGVYMTVQSI
jgi:hypothetical protein